MKADTLSLASLFNKPVSYIVPLFQRPYVWTKGEHWQPLWDDLRTVAERLLAARESASDEEIERGIPEHDTPSHFLGAVVVEQIPTGTGMIERRSVIDGQQRLTTLQLFLDAAHDVATEFGDESAKIFAKLTDNDPDLIRGRVDRFKVWPTNIDQIPFTRTMGKDQTEPDGEADVSDTSMWRAHDYFCEALREWLEDDHPGSVAQRLDALRTVMWSLVRLVAIDLEPNDNAQVIFETLNARGTPLLASDLIKNSLFQDAAQRHLKIEDLYENGWKPLDADWWRIQVSQGRLFRPRLDVFFFHWLTMRRGSDFGVHELFTQYKRYAAETDNAEALLSDIAHYAKTFRSFESHPINTPEEIFFYRLRATETATATPLLLFVLGAPDTVVPADQRVKLMAVLESWLVRRMLCRLTTKNYNAVLMNLLSEVLKQPGAAGDLSSDYFAQLQGESQMWPSDTLLTESLLSLPLYRILSRGRLRMVLEALEDARRPSGTVEESHGPRGLTIEHVLPQTWREEAWPLPSELNPEEARTRRDTLKHSIGNLTLVTNKLNPKLSNAPWSEKYGTLRDHTVLFLNKDLTNNYEERWDEGTILQRGRNLADLATHVWKVPAGLADQSLSRDLPDSVSRIVELGVAHPLGAGASPGELDSFSHEVIRNRTTTPFVREAVDGIEHWLIAKGVRVRHNRRSNHSLYIGNKKVGGYYFARGWVHFSLMGRRSSDGEFEALSQPVSLSLKKHRVSGNLGNEDDLELWKRGVTERLGSTELRAVPRRVFDWSQLHEILNAIPQGRWTTYGDLAQVVGTAAQPLGQHIRTCGRCPNVWRVLGSDGKPRAGFGWSDPDDDRTQDEALTQEGVGFHDGVADPSRYLGVGDLRHQTIAE